MLSTNCCVKRENENRNRFRSLKYSNHEGRAVFAILAVAIAMRLLDVAVWVGLLSIAAVLFVHLAWQPTKRLWIIEWSLVGGLALMLGMVFPWHRFSLGIVRTDNASASAISTNSLPDGTSAIDLPRGAEFPKTAAVQSIVRSDRVSNQMPGESINPERNAKIAIEPSDAASKRGSKASGPWIWLVPAYLLGALVMACWFAAGEWKVQRIVRRASRPAAELAQAWHELQRQSQPAIGSSQLATLLVSDELAFPVAVGVLRPTVLLPRWLVETHSEADLRPVLVHELAHVSHHDSALRWLAAAFQVAFYYQPLFWWLRRQLHLCQEFLADAQAAQSAASASDYAEQLVALLKAAPAGFYRPLPAIGIIEGRSELYRRIQMLVKCPQRLDLNGNRRWKAIVCAALLLLTGSLGLVTLRSRSETAQ